MMLGCNQPLPTLFLCFECCVILFYWMLLLLCVIFPHLCVDRDPLVVILSGKKSEVVWRKREKAA